jgi:adenylate cyclase
VSAANDRPAERANTRQELERLLGELIERPEAETEIAREIATAFEETRAILVLDMSGFSRATRRLGIIACLAMIHRMKRLAGPAVEANGGFIVKGEADNLFCLFDSVAGAVAAARAIVQRLADTNPQVAEEQRLYAAIGIGFGPVLNIERHDLFGDEVNLASKLGEDIAQGGEILLTPAANAEAAVAGIATRAEAVSISGLSLTYFALSPD